MADAGALPPRRRTQTERSEAMRRRLLDSAREIAREKGFAGLRMADVAERAGVSVGAQLHHFPSKNALVIALFEDVYAAMAGHARQRRQQARTLEEAVRALIADGREFFFGEYFAIGLDIAVTATKDDALRDHVLDIIARYRTDIEAAWTRSLEVFGVGHARAVDALWLINSAIRGLAVRAIWDDNPEKFRRVEELCETLLIPYLLADAEAEGAESRAEP